MVRGKWLSHVHYKQSAGSTAHEQQFFSYFPCTMYEYTIFFISICFSILFGHSPTSVGLTSRATLALCGPSHKRGTLAPPRDEGAHVLFLRPFEALQILLLPIVVLSWSICCLRCKKLLIISSTLLNFWGQLVTSIPNLLLLVVHCVVPSVVYSSILLVSRILVLLFMTRQSKWRQKSLECHPQAVGWPEHAGDAAHPQVTLPHPIVQ